MFFKTPLSNVPDLETTIRLFAATDCIYFTVRRVGYYYSFGGDLWKITDQSGDAGTLLYSNALFFSGGGSNIYSKNVGLIQAGKNTIFRHDELQSGSIFFQETKFSSPGFPGFSAAVNHGSLGSSATILDDKLMILRNDNIISIGNNGTTSNIFHNLSAHSSADQSKTVVKSFSKNQDGAGSQIFLFQNKAWFAADDSTGLGQELWTSDGTAAGTQIFKDINPGSGSSKIGNFHSDGKALYFSAHDGQNWGIWKTDGTVAGTQKLTDFATTFVANNSNPSPIQEIFINEKTLFFNGNDGATGFEPWKFDLPPDLPPALICPNNLLKNADFAADLDFWEGAGGEIVQNQNPPAASNSLKFCKNGETRRQTLPVSPGKNYLFEFSAKTAAPGQPLVFGLKFLDKNWQVLDFEISNFESPDSFSTVFLEKIAPAGAAWLEVFATNQNDACSFLSGFCLTDGTVGSPDLELEVSVSDANPAVFSNFSVNFTLKNKGNAACPGVRVKLNDTPGLIFQGANPYSATKGFFETWLTNEWSVGELAAGETAVLTLNFFNLSAAAKTIFGQVSAQTFADADSSPGNNSTGNPTEDDEAKTEINQFLNPDDRKNSSDDSKSSDEFEQFQIFPNPAGASVFVKMPATETGFSVSIFNQIGILEKEFSFQKMENEVVELDLSEVKNGVYFLKIETPGQRSVVKKLVVSRMD